MPSQYGLACVKNKTDGMIREKKVIGPNSTGIRNPATNKLLDISGISTRIFRLR